MDWSAYVRAQLPPLDLDPAREADIVEEIAQQIEGTYDESRARGADDATARQAALETVKDWSLLARQIVGAERSRLERAALAVAAPIINEPEGSGRLSGWWRDIWQDGRHAVRLLSKHRAFTLTAVLTLAITIGANTAIFSIVNTVLLKPLPFPESDRLTVVSEAIPQLGFNEIPFSPPDYVDFAENQQSFQAMGAFRSTEFELSGIGDADRVDVARLTTSMFDVLQVSPSLGRAFTRDEDAPGHDVVILSQRLWRERYGADPTVVGRTLLLDRRPFTIVGVMPAGFAFPMRLRFSGPPASLFIPMAFTAEQLADRGSEFNHTVLGRLRSGVTLTAAQAETDTLIARVFTNYPANLLARFSGIDAKLSAHVESLHAKTAGSSRPLLLLLLATVAALLLIGCANVSNLLLTLASGRRREIALRVSLGALRGRIVRQLLTESAVLAAIGGGAGVVLATVLIDLAPSVLPNVMPRMEELAIDPSVLVFTALISLGSALVFGLVPGLQASRIDTRSTLNDAGRGNTSHGALRLRAAFVVSQCAIALVLLVAAGLLLRTFVGLLQTNAGFRAEQVLATTTFLPSGGYRSGQDVGRFYREATRRLASLPGVIKAGVSTDLPLEPSERRAVVVEGWRMQSAASPPSVVHSWIGGDYLVALGVPLLQGRWLSDDDRETTQPVIVVSKALADRFWPEQDPIGRRIKWPSDQAPWMIVVGVVGDVKDDDMATTPVPHSYTSIWQVSDPLLAEFRQPNLVVSTVGDPALLTRLVRTELLGLDSQLALGRMRPMRQTIGQTLAMRRFTAAVVGMFAVAALLLAALGLHGVLAYSVSQRSQEIGIRMALGAAQHDVMRLIFGHGLRLTVLGVAIGLAIAFGVTRLMETMVYGVSTTDPLTFAGVASLLVAVAAIATWLPTRQALRIDPAITMRES